MKIAVITGASSGMGLEFARAIDREEQLDELLERQRGVGHVLAFGDDPARDGVAHEAGGAGEIRRYFQSIAGYGDPHLNLLFVKQHLPYR